MLCVVCESYGVQLRLTVGVLVVFRLSLVMAVRRMMCSVRLTMDPLTLIQFVFSRLIFHILLNRIAAFVFKCLMIILDFLNYVCIYIYIYIYIYTGLFKMIVGVLRTCQFGMNSIIVLMSVESQKVHI